MRLTAKKQRGATLFIVIMILVLLTILVFLSTNLGKSDARIGLAYRAHTEAFKNAERMLSRLRYALEQIPTPLGVAVDGTPDPTNGTFPTAIWETHNLIDKAPPGSSKDGVLHFANPLYANQWQTGTLTCPQINTWLTNVGIKTQQAKDKDNNDVGPKSSQIFNCKKFDPDNQTRTVIEMIRQAGDVTDIADKHGTYFFRITVRAKGLPAAGKRRDDTKDLGEVIAQGVTGIQYN